MKLPEKDKEVSLPEIKEICLNYGLTDLWTKIENDFADLVRPSGNVHTLPATPTCCADTTNGQFCVLVVVS